MRKVFLVSLGLFLVIVGGLVFTIGFARNDWNLPNASIHRDYLESEESYDQIIPIQVDIDYAHVTIKKWNGDSIKVKYNEIDKIHDVDISVSDKLKITTSTKEVWYLYFGFFNVYNGLYIDVLVPQDYDLNINVDCGVGKASLDGLTADKFDIKCSTGSIELKNLEAFEDLKGVTTTGEVIASNITGPKQYYKTSTGLIKMTNITTEDLEAYSTTGDVKGYNIISDTVVMEASTGRLYCDEITARMMKFDLTTGSIDLQRVDVTESIDMKTSTGSINCRFVKSQSNYRFETSVSTGSTNVHTGGTGSVLVKARATTGSIKLRFI